MIRMTLRGAAALAAVALAAQTPAQTPVDGPPSAYAPPAAAPPAPGYPPAGYPPPAAYAPPPQAQGQTAITTQPERTFALSVQLGPSFGGELSTENGTAYDWDVDPGLAALARLDLYVVQRFTMGLYGQMLRASLPERDEDFGVNGFGLSMIGRFGAPDRPHARLGLMIGYQTNDFESEAADGSEGMGLGLIGEFAYPFSSNASFLAHASFLTQPTGGNDDLTITFGPIFYVAAGIEFGK